MPQLSLYLDEPTMEQLRNKSARAHLSLSKYVTKLIQKSDPEPGWPDEYWNKVYGSLTDPTFVVPEEVDMPLDDIELFA